MGPMVMIENCSCHYNQPCHSRRLLRHFALFADNIFSIDPAATKIAAPSSLSDYTPHRLIE
jgi:hypothetical protein